MAHIWITEKNKWTPRALRGDVFHLPGATPPTPTGAVLRRAAPGTSDTGWLMLTPPTLTVRVNGEPVALGIRALRDKDEIRLPGGAPLFFSTEQLVAVEPFTGSPEGTCPRCTKPIDSDTPAVRCGECNTWYHQVEGRQCFTYLEHPICVVCGADAVVNSEFTWVPEEL